MQDDREQLITRVLKLIQLDKPIPHNLVIKLKELGIYYLFESEV